MGAVLLTGAAPTEAAVVAPGVCAVPGLGRGVRGAGANIVACGGAAAIKTGAPVESDERMTGRAVSWGAPAAGGDAAMSPGIPAAPTSAAQISIYVTLSPNVACKCNGRTLNLRSRGLWFDSRSSRYQAVTI